MTPSLTSPTSPSCRIVRVNRWEGLSVPGPVQPSTTQDKKRLVSCLQQQSHCPGFIRRGPSQFDSGRPMTSTQAPSVQVGWLARHLSRPTASQRPPSAPSSCVEGGRGFQGSRAPWPCLWDHSRMCPAHTPGQTPKLSMQGNPASACHPCSVLGILGR